MCGRCPLEEGRSENVQAPVGKRAFLLKEVRELLAHRALRPRSWRKRRYGESCGESYGESVEIAVERASTLMVLT